jgi:hypothetical protein
MSTVPTSEPAPPPRHVRRGVLALPWPVPALLAWALAWTVFAATAPRLGAASAALAALTAGGLVTLAVAGPWRRALVAAGFPLSALLAGVASSWPPWVWLLALAPLALLYPLHAWRDAPWYPTPAAALRGLDALVVPAPRRVLDAGCGLGHGLRALRDVWPQAHLHGIEWSRPLAWLAARRCRDAEVRRGDMWALDWSGHDLVYLFQRPESMARAWTKAEAELAPQAWLASLEFPVPGRAPVACLHPDGARPVWLYRPGAGAAIRRSTETVAGR